MKYTIHIENSEIKNDVSITVEATSIGEALDNAAEMLDKLDEIRYAETHFILKKRI